MKGYSDNKPGSILAIIKNTSATILVRGLSGLTRIILMLLIAKSFGPVDFGRLSLVLAVVELFKVIADFAVDVVTIRRFSQNRLLSGRLLGNVLTFKLLSASAAYIIANIGFWWIYRSREGLELLLIIGGSLYTTLLVNAFVSYFQANLNMVSIMISSLVSTFFYVSMTILGLYNNWSIFILAAIIPVSELMNLLITAKIYNIKTPISLQFNGKIILSLLKESFPVAIAGIIVVVYSRMDNLMLGWFVGEAGVGVYAAAYRLTEPFLLIFSSLSLSLYASMSESKRPSDLIKTRQTFFRLMVPVLILSFSAALFLFLISTKITGLISDKYIGSAKVLGILSWSILFKSINAQLTAFINSRGKYSYITIIAMNNLIIIIALNLLLLPTYNIIGPAIALVVAEAINTIFQSGCVVYLLGFSFRRLATNG